MGALTRAHNWSQTPLGPHETWPLSLRTTVGIVLHSAFPMFLFWGDELTCFYNDAYRPSLGTNGKHPALGKPANEVWPEIWDFIGPIINQVTDTGEPVFFEDQLLPIHRNGRLENVYWTFSYSPAYGDDGQIGGVFVTCVETTERIANAKLQQQLDLNQYQILASFEQAPVGIAIIAEEKLTFRVANQFYRELVGRAPNELIDKPMLEALPELRGQGFDDLLRSVFATGNPFTGKEIAVNIVRHNRSETIHVDFTYQPQYEGDDRVSSILVVCVDVTEQVLARQKIEESEAKFRSLVYQATVATAVFRGRNLVLELANDAVLEIWDKDRSILGKTLLEFLPEVADQPFPALFDKVFTTGETYTAQDALVRLVRGGKLEVLYLDFSYQAMRDSQGTITSILVMATDVTEKAKARQKIEEAEATLRGAIELAELGTWELDVETGIVTYNDQMKAWSGFETNTEGIDTIFNSIHERDRSRVKAAVDRARESGLPGDYDEEYTMVSRKTGTERVVHAQGRTYFDAQGKPLKIIGSAQDITRQLSLQQELEHQVGQRTQQLQDSVQDLKRSNENLQQFAYVASHDLQEPLRKIQSFGDLLRNQYGEQLGETGNDHLSRMRTSANRMSTLIRDLLTYSRISTQQDSSTPVALDSVLMTVLADLDLLINETSAVVDVASLPTVQGDKSQLGQLFQNLLNNALKFRQPGASPHVSITSRTVAAADLPPVVKPARLATAYHCIAVADQGIGFDEQYVERIFQVFQRLHGKSQYAGTGIGLAICEKVAANHGGAITAQSQPGKGATFSVYLPV